jgi:tRNA dimethylallyltransferase
MPNDNPIKGIAIAGQTASGKSALAMKLARQLNGLIINADSAQVYADLRILTARPSPEDEKSVPHALYGAIDGGVSFSAADWAKAAAQIVQKNEGKFFPILVGGSGLYFRALFEGLAELPPIPGGIRQKWRLRAQVTPAPDLHDELSSLDPQTASRIAPTDKQRTLRALEVIEATGRSLSEIQAQTARPLLDPAKWLRIILIAGRKELEARIAQRLSKMREQGAVEEIKALLARKLDPMLPVMKAIGVPEFSAYLNNETSAEEAAEKIVLATRQYAKRQETWFRNQMPGWQQLTAEEAENLVDVLQAA